MSVVLEKPSFVQSEIISGYIQKEDVVHVDFKGFDRTDEDKESHIEF